MKKSTILYLGGFELPDRNAAAHRVLSNGKIMRDLGYDVVFIGVSKDNQCKNRDILETKNIIEGFDCYSVPYPENIRDWINYLTTIQFLKAIRTEYPNIRLIIAYNYPAIQLIKLLNFSRKINAKLIGDSTEWYNTKGNNLIFKVIKGLDTFLRMRIIHKHLDGLIVISSFLEDYYIKSTNVIKIPPLVDITEEKWITCTPVTSNQHIVKFVYSGSPGNDKDKIASIIKSLYFLRDFKNFQLEIIGLSLDEYINHNKDDVLLLDKLGDRVTFRGRLSHLESLRFVQSADYSIFFRNRSRLAMAGFPTKYVESISSSTKVITNDFSDLKEYFISGKHGYLIADNNEQYIIQLLREKVLVDNKNMCNKTQFDYTQFHYKNYTIQVDNYLSVILHN